MDWWDVTPGRWPLDLTAWGGALTAASVFWKMAVWPFLRAIWALILAAPRVAAGLEKLIDLIEGDVLNRLEAGSVTLLDHEDRLNDHEKRIGVIEKREV